MHKRIIYIASFVAFVVILLMLNFTTPTAVGPLGVLLFFTTVYVLLYGVLTAGVTVGRKILGKGSKFPMKLYLYDAVIAFGPVVLLLMQGFSGIGIWTVGLTIIVVALSCFLVAKKA